MDVARLNFSHGTQDEHRGVIRTLRRIADERGRPVGILADLAGPKIRIGEVPGGPITLVEGRTVTFTSEDVAGTAERLAITYPHLADDVRVGDPILLNDGAVAARVEALRGREVVCRIEAGGPIDSHKGVNFPGTSLRIPSLTDKDRADLAVALEEDVDFIALSFVRSADDIRGLRELVDAAHHPAKIIAKIEKREALEDFDAILEASDAIMVARGDLGVETDLARVPLVQKDLIARARMAARPVITATQMLESMIAEAMPTRAEVADVANAILDGTDAVMLSGETAIGQHPIHTVETMARIIDATEESGLCAVGSRHEHGARELTVSEAIGHSTAQVSTDLRVAAVVVCTDSGFTARAVARFRPRAPIIAGTPRADVVRQLTLSWGVTPVLLPALGSTDELIAEAAKAARGTGIVARGDRILITAGIPFGKTGGTNLLLVQTLP